MRHPVIRAALVALPLAMMMAVGVAGQEQGPSGPPRGYATPPAPSTRAAEAADNLRDFEFVTEKIRLNYAGWDTKVTAETERPEAEVLDGQIARMKANPGGYVAGDTRPFSIMPLDAVRPFPRRVAVLIDGAGSSGEQFILAARQSRKVTLFGRGNSAGVLDFANVVGMTTPSGRFHMYWATSRSSRLPDDPVDPHGIAPDVRIPADVVDPIGFVTAGLERQADDPP